MSVIKGYESKFKIKNDWLVHSLEMADGKSKSASIMAARLQKLNTYFDSLTEAYEGILNACATDDSGLEVVKKYDQLYTEATLIYNKLESISAGFPSTAGTFMPTDSAPSARLPRINLTTFDGDVFSWSSFISLFNSLVLSRKDISKTEKFHYLFSNVEKEPKSLIKHLPMVDASLDTAMELLRSRYENTRLLADSHISRILHLPTLKQASGLRVKILNPLLESTRALKNLGLPTDEWSYLLFHISLAKLPVDIKTRFEQLHGGNRNSLPTFEQLTEFINNECRLLDTASEPVCYSETERPRRGERTVHVGKFVRNENNNANKCAYCDVPGHKMYDCYKFRNLDKTDRKNAVQTRGLCFKCFGFHSAAECTRSVQCAQCGHPGHDSLICFSYPRPISGDHVQGARNSYNDLSRDRWNGSGGMGDRGFTRPQGFRAGGPTPYVRRSEPTRYSAPAAPAPAAAQPRSGYQVHTESGDVRNGWNRTRDDRDHDVNRRWSPRGPSPAEHRRSEV